MKYALVTGANGGMGKATVQALVGAGYTVFAADVTQSEAAEGVVPVICDVTDENSVLEAQKFVAAQTDRLDAIVHFAGIYRLNSLVEISSEEYERIFRINTFGAFLVNKAFLPLLGCGSKIVITTSELAPLEPLPFTGIYAVTKSALDKYAYSLKMELQLLDISVSVIRAGAVQTGMLGVSTRELDKFCSQTQLYKCNAAKFKQIVDSVEAKSVPPQKIAKTVLKILRKKKPRFAYAVNRNFLLRLLNVLPERFRFWVIRRILKTDERDK